MINVLKRRLRREGGRAPVKVARDPSTRFAYDLATKPPTKDVASVKAASDLYDASRRSEGTDDDVQPRSERSINDTY